MEARFAFLQGFDAFVERLRHAVEGARQRADLVVAGHRQAHGGFAALQGANAALQDTQVARQPVADQGQQDHRQQKGHPADGHALPEQLIAGLAQKLCFDAEMHAADFLAADMQRGHAVEAPGLARQLGEILQGRWQGPGRIPALGGNDALRGILQHNIAGAFLLPQLRDQARQLDVITLGQRGGQGSVVQHLQLRQMTVFQRYQRIVEQAHAVRHLHPQHEYQDEAGCRDEAEAQ